MQTNNISFKGFSHTGIGVETNNNKKQLIKNNPHYTSPPYVHLTLTTTLDNKTDKDLQDFALILQKYPNKINKDTVNFHYDKYNVPSLGVTKQEFWLNDSPLILNDKNLPVFSKLAQLFNKLSKMPDERLHTEKYYLATDNCKMNFNYFRKNTEIFDKQLEKFHTPATIRKNAQDMSQEFQKIMTQYFSIL